MARILIALALAASGVVILAVALGVPRVGAAEDATLGCICLGCAFLVAVGDRPPVGHDTGRARSE